MNLRKSFWIILDRDAKRPEVAAAIFQWSCAGFIFCLILGVLDPGSKPELGLLAGVTSFFTATFGMFVLRRAVCGRF